MACNRIFVGGEIGSKQLKEFACGRDDNSSESPCVQQRIQRTRCTIEFAVETRLVGELAEKESEKERQREESGRV